MHIHRNAIAMVHIADAIINGTVTVADTGPDIFIEGQDRNGKAFVACTRPDGRIGLSYDEGGPTREEMDALTTVQHQNEYNQVLITTDECNAMFYALAAVHRRPVEEYEDEVGPGHCFYTETASYILQQQENGYPVLTVVSNQ